MRHVRGTVDLDKVVAELREIDRRTGIDRSLAIGELILTQFFEGSASAWRNRRRNKNNSIRRLAGRPECPFCRSALNEAVSVYVAVAALPCVRTFGHITASHVAAVLRLPIDAQKQILEEADKAGWSVRELRQRVVLLRRADGERRGRPPTRIEVRALSLLRHELQKLDGMITALEQADFAAGELRLELPVLATELDRQHSRLKNLAEAEADVRPRRSVPQIGLAARTA